ARGALTAIEGFTARRIDVIPNAVDAERFAPGVAVGRAGARRELGLPPQAPIVGSVGRFDPVKNQRVLVQLLALLRRRFPDLLLVLVGDGPDRLALERLAQELGVGDALRVFGLQRRVERILPALDVFALPSRSEGIPLALLEAMAAGVPVVAAAVGGVSEAVHCGSEAGLVEGSPDDPACFRVAVGHLLLGRAQAAPLAANAMRRVRDEFGIEAICRRYRDILAGGV